jgi:hypothetical protein
MSVKIVAIVGGWKMFSIFRIKRLEPVKSREALHLYKLGSQPPFAFSHTPKSNAMK